MPCVSTVLLPKESPSAARGEGTEGAQRLSLLNPNRKGRRRATLEVAGQAEKEGAVVEAEVGAIDAGVGAVDEEVLQGEGEIVAQEVMEADAGLEREFEGGAQVTVTDVGGGETDAGLEEGDPAGAGGQIVSEEGPATDQESGIRPVLAGAEELTAKFEMAAEPMVFGEQIGDDSSILEVGEPPIVSLGAAKNHHAEAGPEGEADGLCSPLQALPYPAVPEQA